MPTPKTGLLTALRKPKIGPYSIFDFAASFAAAAAIGPVLGISRERAMWAVVPLSVATHLAFGVSTPLTEQAINPAGDYLPKTALAFSLWQALR